ncbi:MAG: hypothetical protein IT366_19040 [Candidatus Hydrogenedentes bacterium]|nr:hypothetical protein [Candidatus Hydrogenedentota bacterium]
MAPNKKQLKIIELLDRSIQLTREFMNDWLLFNQILSAYPSPGVNKAQLENQFLKIKSKLAREHQVLKESLGADYKFDANTMNIVSGATNLEAIYSQSEVAIKKLQNEWHRSFISINETLGALEDKKVRAEAGENVIVGNMINAPARQGMSKGTKQALIVIGIIIAIIVIASVTGYGQMWVDSFNDLFGGGRSTQALPPAQ